MLKAPAAARALPKLADRARQEDWSYEQFAAALLKSETDSHGHGGQARIKAARFPARKTIEEFDFAFQASLRRDTILHLGHHGWLSPSRSHPRVAVRPKLCRTSIRYCDALGPSSVSAAAGRSAPTASREHSRWRPSTSSSYSTRHPVRSSTVIFYGKDGELTGADREDQETSMLALHLLQSALVHLNTLLVQHVLAEPTWTSRLTDDDRRGLTPLFWSNINPYGTFHLDMTTRIDLERTAEAAATP